ncbi:MAG: AsmA family protein [Pseudomonadota bacterium]|nr:AsmA family protein [Pseudomonadota bacterium]
MRHWGLAASVALGAALGLSLGLRSWPVDPERVRRDLAPALGGLEAPSQAFLTLLPQPTLRITDVKWRAADGAFGVQAIAAELTLRFSSLLGGGLSPLGLTLKDADVRVDLDAAQAPLRALAAPPLTRFLMLGGTVEVGASQHGWKTHFAVANGWLDWPSAQGRLRAAATGRWRGQAFDASWELDRPLAAAHGQTSPVRVAVDAPLTQLRIAGDWSPTGGLDGAYYRGQMSALAPSIARFARWLGREPPSPHAPAGLELEARVSADLRQLKLAEVNLTLGGQAFEGALDFVRSPARLAVSGTLAADAIDLEPLIGPPPAALDDAGAWSAAPVLPEPSRWLDLDLRVSATRAVWRGHAIDNPAAAVSLRDGRFGVKLLDAGLAHGALSGEFFVADKQGACDSGLSLALENADLGALLAEFGERNFSGQGGVKLSLRAHGRSPAEIVASADGDATLEIADGALRTLNFEEALRKGKRKPIEVARDMAAGATRFGNAHGRVEISNGEARFVDASTQAPGLSLAVTGGVDLIDRVWRARVSARQSAPDGQPTPEGAHLDFDLVGPWSGPVLSPLLPPSN